MPAQPGEAQAPPPDTENGAEDAPGRALEATATPETVSEPGPARLFARFSGQPGRRQHRKPARQGQLEGRQPFELDVEFDAPLEGITALFGPSGCGKTTTLRCVAGLERLPGSLIVGEEVWQQTEPGASFLKPHERPIGYVFQEASLFAHLTVRDNLFYGTARAAKRRGTNQLDPDAVIGLLGLEPLLSRAPGALSGGERQRVSMGRALLCAPRLLLMDEPFSALDRLTKESLLPFIETVHKTLKVPILYVSHDISEVARLADRMVLLDRGKVVAQGPIGTMLERLDLGPATGRFEAGVVITARVAGHDEPARLTRLTLGNQTLVIPQTQAAEGQEVRVRIRARDVALATKRPEGISIRNILAGTILDIRVEEETAFAETLVDLGGARVRARVTREAITELGLAEGLPVYALIKSISFDKRNQQTRQAPQPALPNR